MKRVLIDVDGVLADFVTAYLFIVRHVTGRSHVPSDVTTWDINAALGLMPGDGGAVKRAIGNASGLARSLLIYPGALEGVAAIRAIADVYIVTSPWNSNPTWTHDREYWLHKHFGIPHARVVHTSAKHLIRGDVFIDDKTSAVAAWQDANPQGVGVRWETLHNRTEPWSGESTSSWTRLVEIVGQP